MHELEGIGRKMPFSSDEELQAHDADVALRSDAGAAYLHHAQCLETVLWWQHHIDEVSQRLTVELPLLPEEEHAMPVASAPVEVHRAHQSYRETVEKFNCHYDDGYAPDTVV